MRRAQADDDRAAVKEAEEAIFARTIELDDLKARYAELADENRQKRQRLEQERDARLFPLREEVFALRAALKPGPAEPPKAAAAQTQEAVAAADERSS